MDEIGTVLAKWQIDLSRPQVETGGKKLNRLVPSKGPILFSVTVVAGTAKFAIYC